MPRLQSATICLSFPPVKWGGEHLPHRAVVKVKCINMRNSEQSHKCSLSVIINSGGVVVERMPPVCSPGSILFVLVGGLDIWQGWPPALEEPPPAALVRPQLGTSYPFLLPMEHLFRLLGAWNHAREPWLLFRLHLSRGLVGTIPSPDGWAASCLNPLGIRPGEVQALRTDRRD